MRRRALYTGRRGKGRAICEIRGGVRDPVWWTVVRGWRGRRGWSIWPVCTERIATHPRVPPEVHAAVATVLVQKGEQAPVEVLHRTGTHRQALGLHLHFEVGLHPRLRFGAQHGLQLRGEVPEHGLAF